MSLDRPASLTFALAGQPNTGKSTIFNRLTGLTQHVGNWPGKTVEQKSGEFTHDGHTVRLVDLPGTYSLTANSEEERIARDFILREQPDVVIALINAAALERNLDLVTELLELGRPVVIALNMMDVAEDQGLRIEPEVLAAALKVPAIPLVASRNRGVVELLDAALEMALHPEGFDPTLPTIRPEHQPVLDELRHLLSGTLPAPYSERYVALKLLEGDTEITDLVARVAPEAWKTIRPITAEHEDAYLDIAGGRYEWIERMVRAAVVHPKAGVVTITDHLDKVATHPVWGLALLVAVLALVFWLTYTLAMPVVSLLGQAIDGPLADFAHTSLSGAPAWLSSLVVDGLIGGAGMVLSFLPILLVFFLLMGILEDTGYLARMAYVMDRFMHGLGLHGQSALPLFLGFGCNIPAILGTRIIGDRRARLLTILLAPLIPCTARLAVVTFLAPVFFGSAATWVMVGLVAMNLVILAATGLVVNKFVLKGSRTPFIMEMPLYHSPNFRTILLYVWHNIQGFLKKAGTVIVLMSTVVWALSAYPGPGMENSYLAMVGQWLSPIGALMGLGDWRFIVALLTSFVAKENTLATLGILFGTSGSSAGLASQLTGVLAPAAALAFLAVQMTFVPCVATIAVTKQEAGWKWAFLDTTFLLVLSLGVGIAVYHLFSWL